MHIEKARWDKERNPPGQAHAEKKKAQGFGTPRMVGGLLAMSGLKKPGRVSARLRILFLRYHYILSREELKGPVFAF